MNRIKVSQYVLRIHGTFLLLLTTLLITLSTIGTFGGIGIFAFLQANPTAYVGFFQAYSLMMLIGVVLWIGSYQKNLWVWDLIGLLAHVSPLLAIFMFTDLLLQMQRDHGLPSTTLMHWFFILLELLTILYYRFSESKSESTKEGLIS